MRSRAVAESGGEQEVARDRQLFLLPGRGASPLVVFVQKSPSFKAVLDDIDD